MRSPARAALAIILLASAYPLAVGAQPAPVPRARACSGHGVARSAARASDGSPIAGAAHTVSVTLALALA